MPTPESFDVVHSGLSDHMQLGCLQMSASESVAWSTAYPDIGLGAALVRLVDAPFELICTKVHRAMCIWDHCSLAAVVSDSLTCV